MKKIISFISAASLSLGLFYPMAVNAAKNKKTEAAKPAINKAQEAVFPTSISSEFSKLPKGQAIQKTCLAQYNANKSKGDNKDLKWTQKGGGYWSQCNAKLKALSVK